ncbi:MAG: GNAT family N-acetyltransferase [bacterium]
MGETIAVIDGFFSTYLECDLSNVTPGVVWVVPSDRRDAAEPFHDNIIALWLIASGNRCVVSVQRGLEEPVKRVVSRMALGDFRTPYGQKTLLGVVGAKLKHSSEVAGNSGPIFFATVTTFRNIATDLCRLVTPADIPALQVVGLYGRYLDKSIAEGTCFAAFDGAEPVAVAGTWEIPHMADQVAELCVPGTIPARRREGFGKQVVACTTRAVLKSGRVPIYLTSDLNFASIATARAVGYQPYGWQFRAEVVPK